MKLEELEFLIYEWKFIPQYYWDNVGLIHSRLKNNHEIDDENLAILLHEIYEKYLVLKRRTSTLNQWDKDINEGATNLLSVIEASRIHPFQIENIKFDIQQKVNFDEEVINSFPEFKKIKRQAPLTVEIQGLNPIKLILDSLIKDKEHIKKYSKLEKPINIIKGSRTLEIHLRKKYSKVIDKYLKAEVFPDLKDKARYYWGGIVLGEIDLMPPISNHKMKDTKKRIAFFTDNFRNAVKSKIV